MLAACGKGDILFSLPAKCPVQASASCLCGDGNQVFASATNLMDEKAEPQSPTTPVDKPSPFLPLISPKLQLGQTSATNDLEVVLPDKREFLQKVSSSIGPWSKALLAEVSKVKVSKEDPELLCSYRKEAQNIGYKNPTCQDRKCLACEATPPTISPSIIKNLGADFCKMDAAKLTETTMLKKKKPSAPVGKNLILKKKPKDSDEDDKDKAKKKKAMK
ncbi:unnamed protein product [Urochloa humidicola]